MVKKREGCACGKPLPPRYYKRKKCYDCKPKGTHDRKRQQQVTLECADCGEMFKLSLFEAKRRLGQMAKHGGGLALFCSQSCANAARTDNSGALARFKRRAGWTDEKWEWERKLVELNLGMGRGLARLDYGWEGVPQRKD